MKVFLKIMNWIKTFWSNHFQKPEKLLSEQYILLEKNIDLTEENTKLKEKIRLFEQYEMHFENNIYYNVKDGKHEGPYCTNCWDSEKKAIRLHHQGRFKLCPHCKAVAQEDNSNNVIRYYSD